jgi:hypothetical protein
MVCYTESVVVNYVVLFWASGCESWCAMVSQWLWTMVCNTEPVVMNNVVSFWTSICESWRVMPSQWLWIIVGYAEPAGVNHGVLFRASGCESCCVILSQWLWNIMCYADLFVGNSSASMTMIHNQLLLSIAHYDSQPLVQYKTTWFTTTGSE